jgi:hypothetical protein
MLFGAGRLVELARLTIGGGDAKGLLKKLAGLETIAAAIALGLQSRSESQKADDNCHLHWGNSRSH